MHVPTLSFIQTCSFIQILFLSLTPSGFSAYLFYSIADKDSRLKVLMIPGGIILASIGLALLVHSLERFKIRLMGLKQVKQDAQVAIHCDQHVL